MKSEHISDAMALIDGKYIAEAQTIRKKKPVRWRRWAALAACLCLLITGTLLFAHHHDDGLNPDLPSIRLPDMTLEAFGFEGYLYYDISEADWNNPWNESQRFETLPVYKNTGYHSAGIPLGLSGSSILELLEETAAALDMKILEAEWEYAGKYGTDIPDDTVVSITGTTESAEIRVRADGSVRVEFPDGLDLPEEYRFTCSESSDQEAEKTLEYLAEQFSQLLNFHTPTSGMFVDYNFVGELNRRYWVYDAGGDETEDILNYSFRFASFTPDGDGDLWLIDLYDQLEIAEKVGDYPIISVKEARKLLSNGSYVTSVPYEMPGEAYIAKVELVYRNSRTDETWMPYYRFLAELPEEAFDSGKGLKSYGAYYVPAIPAQYIENLPTYDGRFN